MKNLYLKISWPSNGGTYWLSSVIALQLHHYITQSTIVVNDNVNKWFTSLEPEDRAAVKYIHLN